MYLYQREDWPNFSWDHREIGELLSEVRFAQGLLLGRMSSQGFDLRKEADWYTVTEDVLQSSAIEGELLQGDLKGKLTSSKYAKIAKVSQDTASRDIKDLVSKRVLKRGDSAGRSTNYLLVKY